MALCVFIEQAVLGQVIVSLQKYILDPSFWFHCGQIQRKASLGTGRIIRKGLKEQCLM